MDLFVANINEEIFSLYQNNRDETFEDKAMELGIGMATRSMSGWGLKFFDYDNDGNLDLFLANGHPDDLIEEVYSGVKYNEPLLLFQNTGAAFRNVSEQSGPVFAKSFSSRGLAIGDFNNDGAVDVLISVNDGAPVLLRNNNVGQKPLAGSAPGRQEIESGRDRCPHHVPGGRSEEKQDESGRRQFSVLA